MSRLILYMAMSLDGFITGPGDDKGNPAGVGGMRLQEWLGDGGPEVAKAAAGDRDVMLHGAYTAQECLKAGLLDVLEIQLMPVLLGQGRLLFEGLPPEHIELDLVRTLEAPGVLHLRYEVRRG